MRVFITVVNIKTFLMLGFFFVLNFKSVACFQGMEKMLNDGTVYAVHDSKSDIPHGYEFLNENSYKTLKYKTKIKELDSLYLSTSNIEFLQDKALVQVISLDYKNAISTYLEIEKIKPGLYETAANIGTTYELVGDNKKALQWIKKAIAIDSSSHEYSEWIHVNILEAKINGLKTFTSLDLIDTDFGKDSIPVTTLSKVKLQKLYNEIKYQLNERMTFIKPKDAIIAQLLFDLGNIAYLLNNAHAVNILFDRAYDYGYPIKKQLTVTSKADQTSTQTNGLIVKKGGSLEKQGAIKNTQALIATNPSENYWATSIFWGLMFVSLAIIVVVLYKKNKKLN
jgi:tetratricopeptide (TPR) repeat protein